MRESSRRTAKSITGKRSSRIAGSRLAVLALAGAAMAVAHSKASAEPRCLRVVNVDFWDVLYIRERQTHRSKAVGAIAPDHDGILQQTGPCLPAGQSPKRQWCAVTYFPLPSVRISGYVKAYFATSAACPRGFAGAP